jgi:hypothetical protein
MNELCTSSADPEKEKKRKNPEKISRARQS